MRNVMYYYIITLTITVAVTSILSCKCCLLFLSSNSGNHGNIAIVVIMKCCIYRYYNIADNVFQSMPINPTDDFEVQM